MNFTQQQNGPGRHLLGFVVVVLLHVGLIYALVTGLGTNIVEVIKAPIETKIIEEVKPPPPDVPPPPPPPKLAAPPPPYIPPPEIQIAQPPPPTPVATVAVVAPPAPQAPPVARAPVAPSVPDSEVGARAINNVKLVYPQRMQDQGREGQVEVTCDVDADGATSNCAVGQVQGGQAFADAALNYVRQARYKPAIKNGVPVAEPHHRFNISFKLGN
jgi:protein TonB